MEQNEDQIESYKPGENEKVENGKTWAVHILRWKSERKFIFFPQSCTRERERERESQSLELPFII